jgi:hypothetical protein
LVSGFVLFHYLCRAFGILSMGECAIGAVLGESHRHRCADAPTAASHRATFPYRILSMTESVLDQPPGVRRKLDVAFERCHRARSDQVDPVE